MTQYYILDLFSYSSFCFLSSLLIHFVFVLPLLLLVLIATRSSIIIIIIIALFNMSEGLILSGCKTVQAQNTIPFSNSPLDIGSGT